MPSFLAPLLVVLLPLVGVSSLHLFLPVVAPLMMAASGAEPTTYGWVAGAAGLGSIWFYMSNHGLTPALGPLRTLGLGLLLAALGAALAMTAVLPVVLAGAVLLGFGYATSTPAGSQILADHVPRQHWATLFSIRQSGVPLGGAIAGGAGGWLITAFGWRAAFLVMILGCLILGGLALIAAPRHFNSSRPLRRFHLSAVFDPTNFRRPFRALKLAPGLVRLAIACAGFAMVQSASITFFVIYLNAGLGYDLALAGSLYAVLQVASVVGRIMFGIIADRVGSPRAVLVVLAACSSASAILLAALSHGLGPVVLTAVALIVGASVATWNGLYLVEVASLAPAESVSEATAGTTFFVFLTYTITPPVFGQLVSGVGFANAYLVVSAATAVSALVLLLGRDGRRASQTG